MQIRVLALLMLFCLQVGLAFADPLSDVGLFVADKDSTSVAWKAGIYGARPTISGVVSGSAAEQAGLKSGDVILSVGGKQVASTAELRAMAQMPLPVVVLRGMQRITIGDEFATATTTSPIHTPKTLEPPTNPILRIETSMHTAAIKKIATDASGRWLVTASEDKSLRVWDLKNAGSGKAQLVRTIRPPIGDGDEGKLNAVALSPDGNTVACGGFTGIWSGNTTTIYLFNMATGVMTSSITGLSEVSNHLTFSPDGRYLVATLGGRNGIRVYRSSDWSQIGEDREYRGASYSVHFSNDSRLVTTSWDGFLRLYNVTDGTLRLVNKVKATGGSEPYTARFSPDGSRIAVGYADTSSVSIFSGQNLTLLFSPDTSSVTNGNLSSVAWSADGSFLFAGGGHQKQFDGVWKFPISRWSGGGQGSYSDGSAVSNTITDLAPLLDDRIAFGSADPAFGLLDQTGKRILYVPPLIADYRVSQEKFLVAPDGATIRFSYQQWGNVPASFDLRSRNLTLGEAAGNLQAPITTASGLTINGWENTREPKLNNIPLKLQQYERSRSLAITPDANTFVLGTEWYLRSFDRQGQLLWEVPVPGVVWAVNISGNGSLVVAAYADGTIRWHRMSDGKELVAFFPHADRKRWVLWTPEGFFDASPGAEDLIGWHLNRGKDREAEFVSGSAMYKFFYRPDLVQAKFEGKDISAYMKDFDINKVLNQKTLPPKVRFITKPATSDSPDITLRAEVCDNGGGVGDITLYLDNMPVVVDSIGRGLKAVAKGAEGCQQFEKTITLQNGSNSISLMAYNKNNTIESTRDSITITHREAITRKPTLHLLAIAVNSYRDGDLRLKYAIPDAKALAEAVKKSTGGLFEKVQLHTIYDAEVTKEEIAEQFARIGATTRREDVFLLYVAGHGITNRIDGAYYFLPYDFRYTGEDALTRQGVSENDFKKYLAQIQATKSLLLLDTCNSGSFAEAVASRGMIEKTAVNKLVRAVGRATIVASSKDQVALEGYEGHGVFTWTLLEGMKGKAASSDGRITVNNLATFVEETLPKITYKKWGYEQIPQKSLMGMDFPIGMR